MMKKLVLLIFTIVIFQGASIAYAQEAANNNQEDVTRWTENCKHVARFSQELIFTVRLVEPKETATNRQDLLNILGSIRLNDVPSLKKKQDSVIASVKKAPKYTDTFGKSDMIVSQEISEKLNDFIASVSAEADKHGVKCN